MYLEQASLDMSGQENGYLDSRVFYLGEDLIETLEYFSILRHRFGHVNVPSAKSVL